MSPAAGRAQPGRAGQPGQAGQAGGAGQAAESAKGGQALLLLGSPRAKSVSANLGGVLLEGLAQRGYDCDTLCLTGLLESQEGRARLATAVGVASLVILAAPVYVDAPPASVLRAMEFLADPAAGPKAPAACEAPVAPEAGGGPVSRRKTSPAHGAGAPKRLVALVNCGFPEAEHTAISLDIYRLFARAAGFAWAGGLGVGGGGALGTKSLARAAGPGKHVFRALDLAAEALARGEAIPSLACSLAARPLMPRPLYLLVGELGWLGQAWKRRTLFKLGHTPYRTP